MTLDLTLSPETRALWDHLRTVPLGETVAYSTLSGVLGRDVTGAARSNLTSALRIALREDGAAFATIRGVGLRRLQPEEAPDLGTAARRKIRRASNRAVKDMTRMAQASNGLPPEAQQRFAAEISAHGLLAELARDRNTTVMASGQEIVGPARAAQSFLDLIGAKPKTPAS